jgi:hypothetical protein
VNPNICNGWWSNRSQAANHPPAVRRSTQLT